MKLSVLVFCLLLFDVYTVRVFLMGGAVANN